jgi:preprotein translocase subunit SecA
MRATEVLRPGSALGSYPERRDEDGGLGRLRETVAQAAGRIGAARRFRKDRISALVEAEAPASRLSDTRLGDLARQLRAELLRNGLSETLMARGFALTREAAHRTLGLRHFEAQLVGGWVLMHGMLAEMETGEGKTLTATLPACTAALAGIPVHMVTVNDYLADRDAGAMGPVFELLGLSVGKVTAEMSPAQRREAYARDVTYCTSKELAFDFLRDRIAMGSERSRLQIEMQRFHAPNAPVSELVLRGLCFAIVDEADSVLIDEARTPLLIARSSSNGERDEAMRQALVLAGKLEAGRDFQIEARTRSVRLSDRGRGHLDSLTEHLGGVWSGRRRRELLITQAISAVHLYLRDRHYLVRDDKIQIIDENTGRLMPDRAWERGLHQMIEAKEACPLTGTQETLARTTYQRFFRRYLRLSGMTGTAREVARELRSVYRLPVIRVETHRPVRRMTRPQRTFVHAARKWEAIVERVRELNTDRRPVLVGTRTVEQSEHLSGLLAAANLDHQVLNARQHASEAELVSRAGWPGAITVATNMAGRGTDIPLGMGVAALGGLHVLAAERNESPRIDRQLYGRCGRQGDPGSFEAIVALDDDLPTRFCPRIARSAARIFPSRTGTVPAWLGAWIMWIAQRGAAREHFIARRQLQRSEGKRDEMLAFTGRPD